MASRWRCGLTLKWLSSISMQKFAIPKHHPRASKFWCQKRIHAEMSCFGGWRPSLVGSLQSFGLSQSFELLAVFGSDGCSDSVWCVWHTELFAVLSLLIILILIRCFSSFFSFCQASAPSRADKSLSLSNARVASIRFLHQTNRVKPIEHPVQPSGEMEHIAALSWVGGHHS